MSEHPASPSLVAMFNVRDLGGTPAAGGRVVRAGRLIRGDSPHEATDADLDHLLNTLQISDIVDLRADREVERDGMNPKMPGTVIVHRFPIAGGPGSAIESAAAGERLAARYLEYLSLHTGSVVGAVRAVAHSRGAVLVHCRAGKDRTGVVVALVLDVLGVAADDIAADYQLTTEPMRRIMERLRASETYAANVSKLPAEMYSSDAVTMSAFLGQLHERFGSAAAWLTENGLDQADLDLLRTRLLSDTSDVG